MSAPADPDESAATIAREERVRDGAGFRHRSLFGQGKLVSSLANMPFISSMGPDD